MKTRLIIPPHAFRLRWTTHHEASRHGAGVLLDGENRPLTAGWFADLRDGHEAWIETTDPARARAALGVPDDFPGIIHVTLGEATHD